MRPCYSHRPPDRATGYVPGAVLRARRRFAEEQRAAARRRRRRALAVKALHLALIALAMPLAAGLGMVIALLFGAGR